jgi:hypothetical protein
MPSLRAVSAKDAVAGADEAVSAKAWRAALPNKGPAAAADSAAAGIGAEMRMRAISYEALPGQAA